MTRIVRILAVAVAVLRPALAAERLIFEDDFDSFNLSLWKHEITLSGEVCLSSGLVGCQRPPTSGVHQRRPPCVEEASASSSAS
jgi:hypothetical protein